MKKNLWIIWFVAMALVTLGHFGGWFNPQVKLKVPHVWKVVLQSNGDAFYEARERVGKHEEDVVYVHYKDVGSSTVQKIRMQKRRLIHVEKGADTLVLVEKNAWDGYLYELRKSP
jgi:hypothetical protein